MSSKPEEMSQEEQQSEMSKQEEKSEQEGIIKRFSKSLSKKKMSLVEPTKATSPDTTEKSEKVEKSEDKEEKTKKLSKSRSKRTMSLPETMVLPSNARDSEEGEVSDELPGLSTSASEPIEPAKKKKPTTTLLLQVLMTAFGSSLQFGYHLWGINHPYALSKEFFNKNFEHMTDLSEVQKLFRTALLVSVYSLGGLIGTLVVGPLSDRFGRKATLMANNLLSLLSAIILSATNYMIATFYYYYFSLISRGITGVCSGMFSIAVPMYLGEIAPQYLRGAIIMVAQLFVAIGVLMAQILGLPAVLGSPKGWPLYLSFTGMLAIFQLFLLPSFPESPRYLLIRKREEAKARQALKMLRVHDDDVDDEIEEIQEEDMAEMPEKEMTPYKLLRFRDLRWQLLSAVIMMAGRELSGINAAYYYAELIFHNATGITEESVRYFSMGSTTIVIFTLLVTIFVIEIVGRRTLLLMGLAICCITCILLTMTIELQVSLPWMSHFTMVLMLIFLIGHTMGPSPIPDVVVTELFLQSSRASAFVIGGSADWLCNFMIGFVFVFIKEKVGPYCFFVYWPFCVAHFIYIFKVIPDTTNRSFLEVRRIMTIHILKIVMHKSKPKKRFSRRSTQRSFLRSKRRVTMFP